MLDVATRKACEVNPRDPLCGITGKCLGEGMLLNRRFSLSPLGEGHTT
jgi:hypothetical protein